MAPVRRSLAMVVILVGAACTADTSRPPATPPAATATASFGPAGGSLIAFHSDPAGAAVRCRSSAGGLEDLGDLRRREIHLPPL